MIDLKLDRKLFNDAYYQYLSSYEEPLELYYGGAGSGKSVFIGQKILIKALNDQRKVLIMRKVGTSINESVWRLMLELLSQWKIYQYCNIRISDRTITLPNGSVFLFRSLDDPEKIKSIVGISDIWLEEANEFNSDEVDQLQLRMRAKKKNLQMFLSFNPVSKASYLYKRYFAEDAIEHPFILHTTYLDNKFLPDQYIESLEKLKDTNYTYWKIYAKGEFVSLDKLVFNNWEVRDFDYREIQGDLLCGLDFGFSNDPTAFNASILTEDELYIFKEYNGTNKTNPQIAEIIKSLGFSKSVIVADAAEPKSLQELKENGIYRIRPSVKGKDSVIHGIQKLQQYKIIIHPDCISTITEFENYSWVKDRKTGEYQNQPVDMWNHHIDAIRYSLQCTKKKLRTISKAQLGV